jgi:hypothetical protein
VRFLNMGQGKISSGQHASFCFTTRAPARDFRSISTSSVSMWSARLFFVAPLTGHSAGRSIRFAKMRLSVDETFGQPNGAASIAIDDRSALFSLGVTMHPHIVSGKHNEIRAVLSI